MNGYDTLAWFYDKYWTQEAPLLFTKLLERALLEGLPEKAAILDLCCGTGQMCEILSGKGFSVTGIDNSAAMVEIASKNAPEAFFSIQNASSFSTDIKFDAVISIFDSINHILQEEELLGCFKSVKKALKDDCVFLFDVNDEETFDENWVGGFSRVEDDNVCVLKPEYDLKTKIATYHTAMFRKKGDNCWERADSTVFEKYYSDKTLLKLLKQAGFINIQVADGRKDLGITEFDGRRFFTAR